MVNLKHFLSILCLSCVLVSTSQASWLSDFLSSANISVTKEAGGYYKTQASGFLTGGGVRVRWTPMGPIQFFNYQSPSINVGCNGIDATWGSFSYMDFDQLVEKIKKLATAAPAFATQLAMSTLCKDCQAILGELEAVANAINSLNFDACKIAMDTAKNVGESLNSSILDGKYKDFTIAAKEKIKKGRESVEEWASSINAGVQNLDYNYNSPSNRELEQGSIVQMAFDKLKENRTYAVKTITNLLAQNNLTDEQEQVNFIRALYGDFIGYISDGGVAQWAYIQPHTDVSHFVKTFWVGDENTTISYPRYKQHECDRNVGCKPLEKANPEMRNLTGKITTFKKVNEEAIKRIVESIRTGQDMSNEDLNFINYQSVPLLDMLNLYASNKLGIDETIVEQISLTMFKLAMEDLNSEIQQTISRLNATNAFGRAKNSDNVAYNSAMRAFETTRHDFMRFFNQEFAKASQELQNKVGLVDLITRETQRGFTQLGR